MMIAVNGEQRVNIRLLHGLDDGLELFGEAHMGHKGRKPVFGICDK